MGGQELGGWGKGGQELGTGGGGSTMGDPTQILDK